MSPPSLDSKLLRVEPELLQHVGVLFGVDMIGQLLLGLVALALPVEHFEDHVFWGSARSSSRSDLGEVNGRPGL
jgi:hypothetical protein